MPRKPRQETADGPLHVFARGNDRRRIFLDDADFRRYLRTLGRVGAHHGWRCLAYCLMPNHVHLLLETPRANLAPGVRQLHGTYAQDFNTRYERCGHLFQGRYGAVHMRDDAQVWTVAAYLARNPVDAGLCGRPEQWLWSSHAAALRARRPAWLDERRLLAYFDALGGDPLVRYREIVEDRLARGLERSPRRIRGQTP